MRVLTIGTFDTLHPGHLELLEGCRTIAGPEGRVFVGVNRDAFVVRYKRRAPVQKLAHRIELLCALRFVDDVFVNVGDEDSSLLIEAVRPDQLAIGDDWLDPGHDEARYFRQLGVTEEWMTERNLRVFYLPRTRGVSSRAMRGKA